MDCVWDSQGEKAVHVVVWIVAGQVSLENC